MLRERRIRVRLHRIPGHSGNKGNEDADRLTKQVVGLTSGPRFPSPTVNIEKYSPQEGSRRMAARMEHHPEGQAFETNGRQLSLQAKLARVWPPHTTSNIPSGTTSNGPLLARDTCPATRAHRRRSIRLQSYGKWWCMFWWTAPGCAKQTIAMDQDR